MSGPRLSLHAVLICALGVVALTTGCGSKSESSEVDGPTELGIDDGAGAGRETTVLATGDEDVEMALDTGAKVNVRKGAVSEEVTLGLKRPADREALTLVKSLDPGRKLASAPYVVTPHGTKFKVDVEVVLPVAKGSDPKKLRVMWLEDERDSTWKVLGTPAVAQNTAKIDVDHFSVLVLVEDEASGTDGPGLDGGQTDGEVSEVRSDAGTTRGDAADPEADAGTAWGCVDGPFDPDGGACPDDAEPQLACGPGTWNHDDNPASACIPWSTCGAGEYVGGAGSATSDRACTACPSGNFSGGSNAAACVPHAQCPVGTAVKGTPASDVTCAAPVAALAAGYQHNCALRTDGTVTCWNQAQPVPQRVAGLSDVTALAANRMTTCALRAGGSIACWGDNSSGQLGNGSTAASDTPVAVYGVADAKAISVGDFHVCALRATGSVLCWGMNPSGQLGDDTTTTRLVPVAVSGLSNAVAIAAGSSHSCAVRANGSVACWGNNDAGALGDGSTTGTRTPVAVSGMSNALAVAVGSRHSCALAKDGSVACWGRNVSGQLGNGSTIDSWTPVLVSGVSDARALSAGSDHTCALRVNGEVLCWGDNDRGQLGDGTERLSQMTAHWSATPVVVVAVPAARALVAGPSHTCALREDGSVVCWGWESAIMGGAASPTDVLGLADGVAVAAGAFAHTCAARSNGGVACWGSRGYGQLGNPEPGSPATSRAMLPLAVDGVIDAVSVAAGNWHSCALRRDGSASCWGYNYHGELGDGTGVSQSSEPVVVYGLSGGVALAAGHGHTCALRSGGSVACWGRGAEGQLGDGTATNRSIPVVVSGLSDIVAIGIGHFHSCAVRVSGSVVCWGSNSSGQLGDGTYESRNTPVLVTGVTDAISVAAADRHTCALRRDRTVVCWGSNAAGQLGDGSTTDRTTPVAVNGLSDVAAVATGLSPAHFGRSCALRTSGDVWCWGDGGYAAAGSGTFSVRSRPAQVGGLTDVTSLSLGGGHACAVRASGALSCWGDNYFGQLGTPLSGPFWQ